jgi:hypothetical protein
MLSPLSGRTLDGREYELTTLAIMMHDHGSR